MPIDEEILKTLIYDKIREKDVPLRAIRQWTEHRLSVYIATLTVKPSGNKKLDRERGSFLIKQTIKWALSLNRQFDVKNWYGIGATPEGQELFERLGFRGIASLHNGERKGYLAEDIKQPVKLVNDMLTQVKRSDTSLTAKEADNNV
ncbi:hypothetical protein [Ktedonospora formicarum]|nr:hypothetical protein [Ktedonospora formicarum]